MSLKKLSEEKMTAEIFIAYIAGSIVDSYIVMLALGGLSHQLHKPSLALAYWSCWLIVVIAYALFDNGIGTTVRLDYLTRMVLRGERLR
jgi:hypothetical protein